MKIKSADFIMSNTDVGKCPAANLPEYAFIGRSNVGKSSLINMLLERKNLAKTSGTPGKTQLINHYKINDAWFLVDLPGYGYARVSKKERKRFQRFIQDYFLQRTQLLSAFVLVDIRHKAQPSDLEFMEWLGRHQIPFAIIFTKSDKLKPAVAQKNVSAYIKVLQETGWAEVPPYFVTSSVTRSGREEILAYIGNINSEFADFKRTQELS